MSQKGQGKLKRGLMRDIGCSKSPKGRLSNIELLKTRHKEAKKQLKQQREGEMQKTLRRGGSSNISKLCCRSRPARIHRGQEQQVRPKVRKSQLPKRRASHLELLASLAVEEARRKSKSSRVSRLTNIHQVNKIFKLRRSRKQKSKSKSNKASGLQKFSSWAIP